MKVKATLVHDNFKRIKPILKGLGIEKIDGEPCWTWACLPFQLDEGERGFSYNAEAPLDMRMDRGNPLSAYEVVNGYSEDELKRVIREYGEERWAARIAQFITKERETKNRNNEGIDRNYKAGDSRSCEKRDRTREANVSGDPDQVNAELTGLREALEDYVSVKRKWRAVSSNHLPLARG